MITRKDLPFIDEEIKKNKIVHSILKSIIDNSESLKHFGLELRLFKNGIELKSR